MDPIRGAYYLLKGHLLHYDVPRPHAKGASARPPAGANPASPGAPAGATQGANGGPNPEVNKQRLFGGRGSSASSEVTRFITDHIQAIRNADPSTFGTPPSMSSGRSTRNTSRDARDTNISRRDKLTHDLEYAHVCLQKSHERFPSPRLSLLELTRAMATHMVFHKSNQGTVSGEYIMKALTLFYGVEKTEALNRYVGALISCGCLRPHASTRAVRSVGDFEKGNFYVLVPAELREMHKVFDFREPASRLVCIYCTRAVEDGANELIYLSHSRWLLGEYPPPLPPDVAPPPRSIDDPVSMFPEQFRRGFVGPLFQFISSFCLSECHMFETLHDQCAIIRLNGVKMVVMQLFASNIPSLVKDGESGKLARCDTPCVLMMGLPERIPNNVIHMGMKKLLDAVEMCIGPRSLYGTDLTPEAFREEVRRLGSKIFSLTTHLFFTTESPDCTFEPTTNAQELNKRELGGLVDNGILDQNANAARAKRPINGFPTRVPFSLNHRSSTHALSRKSCSSATQILLSLRDTCAAYGGCVCSAMFYHGALVLSDTHPYVTALLGLFARWSLFKAQPVPQQALAPGDGGDVTQATIVAHLLSRVVALSSESSTGFPARDQLPAGVFADMVYGEPANRAGNAGTQGSPGPSRSDPPTPASPNGASPRASEAPSSPTHDAPGYAPSSSSLNDDEGSSLLPSNLAEQTLYPGYCFLSEELVALLPKPTGCPSNQRADADTYKCHDPLSPSAHIETMEPGFYHTVHLSANGVDIVLVLPKKYEPSATASSPGPMSSPQGSRVFPTVDAHDSIRAAFQLELSSLGREISSLSTQLSRSDIIPREVETNPDGGSGDSESGGHVDPTVGTSRDSGNGSNPAAHGTPGGSGATTMQTAQSAMSASLCAVHDLALGVTEFVEGSLGSQEEIAHHQRVVPSALMLNRATVFLKEANALSQLLGTPFRQPLRHPDLDNGAMDPPFAIEPTTRVILGRSAFAEKDRRGPHAVMYSRQSGGQQVYFGVPTVGAAAAATAFPVTLRNVEDQYVQFVSSSRSHTVVI